MMSQQAEKLARTIKNVIVLVFCCTELGLFPTSLPFQPTKLVPLSFSVWLSFFFLNCVFVLYNSLCILAPPSFYPCGFLIPVIIKMAEFVRSQIFGTTFEITSRCAWLNPTPRGRASNGEILSVAGIRICNR